jgi:hypothetical protein
VDNQGDSPNALRDYVKSMVEGTNPENARPHVGMSAANTSFVGGHTQSSDG